MRIRIFRAATLAGAMAQVRDELGLDALILTTSSQGGVVEVTAALEPEDEPDPPALSGPAPPLDVQVTREPAPAYHASAPLQSGSPLQDTLGRHGLPPSLLAALRQGPLEAGCSRLFRFTRLPLDADAPPLLLAGPPGAGKTLTVAKLAARLVMEGHRPLVITSDEQRAGAVEQLAAFTRLLGLTLIAAGRPEMLERALQRREPLSPVLIDAPGLDLLDPAQAEQLACLVSASGARLALALPAGLDPLEAVDIAMAHAGLGADLLVATRLDRNGRLGGVLAAAQASDLALTEAGTGPGIADGLAQLTPMSVATRLGATESARAPTRAPGNVSPGMPAMTRRAPLDPPAPRDGLIGGTLALHIAAQTGASRLPLWKTNP
ncbi:hypothetical protein [Lichenicola sp.]|uniref:flagellar biosynthesis protein FlhF n=1 Tax=Lichenicola sp. TaxID=2804529 RepID=UPI003B00C8CA